MKMYSVVAEAPATAFWVIEAESEDDAIRQVKDEIAANGTVDFEVCIQNLDDSGDVDFCAVEVNSEEHDKKDEHPELTVVLDGTVHKEITVNAASHDAALDLVDELCFSSGLLHFCGDDVNELTTSVKEPESDPVRELLLRMVRDIRSSDAPDALLVHVLQAGMDSAIALRAEQ